MSIETSVAAKPKIHILGICGTFMGSLALLARSMGYEVSGSDQHVYPPMSTQLADAGIEVLEGYDVAHLNPKPDVLVIGNVMSRGNPCVEYALNKGIPFVSGPGWLSENLLKDRWVLAVSGTHGKTTTTAMLAWILEYAGLKPGFLIGGVPKNFSQSAQLGEGPFFVIEADEYDSAFFDKRSKFIHYCPKTLIINNLEFDHADIFANLDAIQTQFHHLIRILPGEGRVLCPVGVDAIDDVLQRGCWTPIQRLDVGSQTNNPQTKKPQSESTWLIANSSPAAEAFDVFYQGECMGRVVWEHTGQHNMANALAAIGAAQHVGVEPHVAIEALGAFKGVARRMELIAKTDRFSLYDDFAHHPTAMQTTLEGLRKKVGNEPICVILEPRSNTMKMGVHQEKLLAALTEANEVLWYDADDLEWDLNALVADLPKHRVFKSIEAILNFLAESYASQSTTSQHWLLMSNGGFGGIHKKIKDLLV